MSDTVHRSSNTVEGAERNKSPAMITDADIISFAKQGIKLLAAEPTDLHLVGNSPSSLLYRILLGALAPYHKVLIEAKRLAEI